MKEDRAREVLGRFGAAWLWLQLWARPFVGRTEHLALPLWQPPPEAAISLPGRARNGTADLDAVLFKKQNKKTTIHALCYFIILNKSVMKPLTAHLHTGWARTFVIEHCLSDLCLLWATGNGYARKAQ